MNRFPLDFIVPGFGKSGTTSICHMLAQHPSICFSDPKEPNFFTSDTYASNWNLYASGFSHGNKGQCFGEASTRYTSPVYEQRVSDDLYRLYPNLKLVFVVREPIARIESSFREMHFRGPEYGFDTPFLIHDAIDAMPMMKQGSQYWQRLKPFFDKFPAKQIHIVFFEDYVECPQNILDSLFLFLGLAEFKFSAEDFVKLNSEETKLCDTRLLRYLRNTIFIGPLLSKLSRETQDRIFVKIGLRKNFASYVEWDESYKAKLVSELRTEMDALLSYVDRSDKIWGYEYGQKDSNII